MSLICDLIGLFVQLSLPKQLHSDSTIGSTYERTNGNHQDIDQLVPLGSLEPEVWQVGKMQISVK